MPVRNRPNLLVQACESLAEPKTKKREVAALSEAMGEMGIKTGTIVTRNEQEQIDLDGGSIQVVPAWRFLIDLPEEAE